LLELGTVLSTVAAMGLFVWLVHRAGEAIVAEPAVLLPDVEPGLTSV
jgi:hypothetical protein